MSHAQYAIDFLAAIKDEMGGGRSTLIQTDKGEEERGGLIEGGSNAEENVPMPRSRPANASRSHPAHAPLLL